MVVIKLRKVRGKKWIHHPAGFISLLGIPMLCLWILTKQKIFVQEGAMEINVWSPKLSLSSPTRYGRKDLFPYPINKKWEEINLSGVDEEDKIKLEYAQLAIRALMISKDLKKGIQIHWNDTSKYKSLIRALEICDIEDVKVYSLYGNKLWVSNLEPPKEYKLPKGVVNSFCGGCIILPSAEVKEFDNPIYTEVQSDWKTYSGIGLLFLAMVLFAIKKALNMHKLSRYYVAKK